MIPAITIWQPWASLIAARAKPYEWREWKAPGGHIGKRIGIHAGARPPRRNEIRALLYDLEKDPALTSLDAAIAVPLLSQWLGTPKMLPLSSMLCTAILGQPISATYYACEHGVKAADSTRIDHTKWGWPLTDIEVLEPFVPSKGAQGIWYWIGP
jgi:hypothetical protein